MNEELDQAMKDIRQFGDKGAEGNRRITELESRCMQHEEAIMKLKQENMSLELGIQSHNELILEIATKMGLDRMGEDDNEDEDDDRGDAAAPAIAASTVATAPASVAPAAATAPKVVAEVEEDLGMMILEQEAPEALEVILSDKESKPPHPCLFTILMRDLEESPSRSYDNLDDPTLADYDEEDFYLDADD
jgi:hypothetical protein